MAATLLETHGEPYGVREFWQVACGGATAALIQSVPEDAREAAALVETITGWLRLDLSAGRLSQAVAAAASCPKVDGLSELWGEVRSVMPSLDLDHDGPRQPVARILDSNVADWLCGIPQPPDLVLLTGPVMRLTVAPGETLGDRLVRSLRVPAGCKVLVSGRDLPPAVNAAHGCAIYGNRELAGLPTYLDTLPRFCIVGKDRLRWKDVHYNLVQHSEWEGGKEYRPSADERERLRDAAKIPGGRRRVRFRLLRQDQEKQLEQSFEKAPLRDCLLSFDVRLRPAQGFATVRIVPDQPDLFGGKEVLLDWEKMEDASGPPEGPPDFPPCAPLESDPWRIQGFAPPAIDAYAQAVMAEWWQQATPVEIGRVGAQLQSGRAYGSSPSGRGIDTLLEALEQHNAYYCQLRVYQHLHSGTPVQRRTAEGRLKDLIACRTSNVTTMPIYVA